MGLKNTQTHKYKHISTQTQFFRLQRKHSTKVEELLKVVQVKFNSILQLGTGKLKIIR